MNGQTQDKSPQSDWKKAISLAWDLGFFIALPLVIFGLGGRLLDKKINTTPLFFFVGLFVALAITSVGVYRKARQFGAWDDNGGKKGENENP